MTLMKTIFRDIRAYSFRFFTIALVIAIGVTSLIAIVSGVNSLDNTYLNSFKEHNMASFTIQTANPSGTGEDAWVNYNSTNKFMKEFMGNNDIVEAFELRIVHDLVMKINGSRLYGRIVAFNTSFDSSGTLRKQPDVNGYLNLEGGGFTEISKYRNVCLIETHLAEYWNLEEGSFISVGKESIPFQSQGRIASPEYLLNMGSYADLLPSPRRFGVIFVPLRTAQRLLNAQGRINEISVKLKDGTPLHEREKVAKELKSFLEGEGLMLGEPVDIDYQVSYYLLRLDAAEGREMGMFLPIILLGMAMAGLYILLGRMVVAERKEIGVTQALGYSRKYIILHYVGIAVVIAIIGTIIGTIAGILIAQEFSLIYVGLLGIRFPIPTEWDWGVIFTGIFLGIATGFIGGYLPVRSAIQPTPAESLRFDPSLQITSGKIPLIECMLNFLHIYPSVTGVRLPLRNFFRSRRRTYSSLLGIFIAVSMTAAGFGMIDSMDYSLGEAYLENEDYDLKIEYNEIVTNSSDIVAALNTLDSVEIATYSLSTGALVTSTESSERKIVQLVGLEPGIDGHYTGHKFRFVSGGFNPDKVVLSVPIAEKLKVGIGDSVALEVANLTTLVSTAPLRAHFEMINISIEVSGIMEEMNGMVAYIGLNNLKEMSNYPGNPATSVVIKMKEESTTENIDQLRKYIYDELGYNIRIISTPEENIIDLMGLVEILYLIVYMIALFSLLLAVIMVYNTVYINLQERTREIATLLTMGTPSRKIYWNITIENFMILAIGGILGLIGGYVILLSMFVVILDMEFMRFTIIITPMSIVITEIIAVLSVLIGQFVPLRNILNLDLAEATKERVI